MKARIKLVDSSDGCTLRTENSFTGEDKIYVEIGGEAGVFLDPSQVKALRRDLKDWLIEKGCRERKG